MQSINDGLYGMFVFPQHLGENKYEKEIAKFIEEWIIKKYSLQVGSYPIFTMNKMDFFGGEQNISVRFRTTDKYSYHLKFAFTPGETKAGNEGIFFTHTYEEKHEINA